MTDVRFTTALHEALVEAGWTEGRRPDADAEQRLLTAVLSVVDEDGLVEPSEAVQRFLEQYGDLTVPPVGPGVEVAAHGAVIDPEAARGSRTVAAALARRLGTSVFPVGRTGDGVLAVDAQGRLFRQGRSDWWYLGATPEEGLARLVEGYAPARVEADGRWSEPDPLPRTVHQDGWVDNGPASELLAAGMALAAEATRPLRRHGVPVLGHLTLTVEGEGAELPILYREFDLDPADPEGRIADIVDRTFLRPGTRPVRVTVRLAAPPAAADRDWDVLVVARADRSRRLTLRHRGPAGQQPSDQVDVSATVAALSALGAEHRTTGGTA
ncbi:SUKH-3 domain-containing protein [Kitasatospora sp. NPDC059795]|uniref:SUKH-3 domain-containing protein n=1 Tax=Kitasatospora sp. NPDC059795 TaxID=3346949 RepID=UPI00365B7F36